MIPRIITNRAPNDGHLPADWRGRSRRKEVAGTVALLAVGVYAIGFALWSIAT